MGSKWTIIVFIASMPQSGVDKLLIWLVVRMLSEKSCIL